MHRAGRGSIPETNGAQSSGKTLPLSYTLHRHVCVRDEYTNSGSDFDMMPNVFVRVCCSQW